MGPELIAVLAILAFLILIALEMPIALAIGVAGVMGIVLQTNLDIASKTVATVPFSATSKYALFVIPMYVLLGCVISNAGIGMRIFNAVNRFVAWLPGGLAAATVAATSIFSGISGSSAADVATFGRISVNEMHRNGYDRAYSAAVVAAAGTFAVLIPPSITIVIYAILAELSIGAMILAGLMPGLISCVALALFVIVVGVREKRRMGAPVHAMTDGGVFESTSSRTVPVIDASGRATEQSAAKVFRSELIALLYALILFLIVVGGLYLGLFTATEAGALGAFAALIIAILAQRFRLRDVARLTWAAVRETANITSMIFLLLIGGALFTYSLALSGLPVEISRWATELPIPPIAILGIVLLLLIPLGAFLDGLSIMLLTVPIIAPVAIEMGFDGIWFGILVIKCIEIGLITPPVGVNAFIVSGIVKIPVERVFRALLPFVLLDIAITALFFFFPETILWLPRAAGIL